VKIDTEFRIRGRGKTAAELDAPCFGRLTGLQLVMRRLLASSFRLPLLALGEGRGAVDNILSLGSGGHEFAPHLCVPWI